MARSKWDTATRARTHLHVRAVARAFEHLIAILERSTFDNLWDKHPPFQIDGNFGATAAITEMLVHSHNGEVRLLPALPAEWTTGSFSGLRARGDITVSATWKEGALQTATVDFGVNSSGRATLAWEGKRIDVTGTNSVTISAADFR